MKKIYAKIIIVMTIFAIILSMCLIFLFYEINNTFLAIENDQYYGGIKTNKNEGIITTGMLESKQEFSIVFELSRKPESWSQCFIRLYVVDYNNTNIPLHSGHEYGIEVWLSNSSFKDESFPNLYNIDYWTYRQFDQEDGLIYKGGFQMWEITEFIEGRTIISLSAHAILWTVEHYISFYSLDANVETQYKPQLIWS